MKNYPEFNRDNIGSNDYKYYRDSKITDKNLPEIHYYLESNYNNKLKKHPPIFSNKPDSNVF